MRLTAFVALFSLFVPLVYSHALITNVKGKGGNVGMALNLYGVNTKQSHAPFYYATRWLTSKSQYKIGGVDRRLFNTISYGIDWKAGLNKAIKAGLPTPNSDRTITANLFQVNKDGAGPYKCEMNTDATGKSWKSLTVLTNVPGNKKGENAAGAAKNHKLKIQFPYGTKCEGKGNSCLVRCKNPNVNAFGGLFAVTM